MTNKNIIKGLQILDMYCEKESYKIGVSNEQIYFDCTDIKIENGDLEKLVNLGWFQEDANYQDEFTIWSYDPDCRWVIYV